MATKREELDNPNSCLAKAADDEPVFVLRAQDRTSAALVEQWADMARRNGCPPAKVEEARQLAARMRAWPTQKFAD